MAWNREIPTKDGLYWVKNPIKGSPGKYWSSFLAKILVRKDSEKVRIYADEPIAGDSVFVGPEDGYLFSEEVKVPD